MDTDYSELNPEAISEIKKTFSAIKALDEERKGISEDIRTSKLNCSKKTGLTVKDINGIIKVLRSRENGTYSEDYIKIAKVVEGKATLD